ncbi:MAG: hypothetical protein IKI95_04590 [Clostridia bacterium]|nr:hypothetical protein [Clostridia bacterium]
MKKIEYNGEIYYYYNNKFVDSTFIEVDSQLKKELAKILFSEQDFKTYKEKELLTFIKETKQAEAFSVCKDACLFGLDGDFSFNFKKVILPILTSTLRNLKQSSLAIEKCSKYTLDEKYVSVPLCTSLASAYCDVGNYEKAFQYANLGYAIQGGGLGYNSELSLVYMRIKKESNIKVDFID